MVTVFKVLKEKDNNEQISNIDSEFYDRFDISLFDRILIKESTCGKYEYLYFFLSQEQINSLVNLFIENGVEILSKFDFTEEMVKYVKDNEIVNFKKQFIDFETKDELISLFYEKSVGKDDILDKIIKFGTESLTNDDFDVLKS